MLFKVNINSSPKEPAVVTHSSSDILRRGLADNGLVRFAFTRAPEALAKGMIIHNTDPLSAMVWGQAMLCSLLTVPLMTAEQRTTSRWEYQGTIGKLLCEADDQSRIRGVPQHPHLMAEAATEETLFGDSGTVSIVRSCLKSGKILNSGTCRVELQSVPDDFAFLLCLSDQIETEVVTHIGFRPDPESPVETASALMIQAMPDADLLRFETLRRGLRDPAVQALLFNDSVSPETALADAFLKIGCLGEPEIFDCETPRYVCSCDQKRMITSIQTLAANDLDHLFADRNEIELVCQFCHTPYKLSRNDCHS